jgi:hypothetical protein
MKTEADLLNKIFDLKDEAKKLSQKAMHLRKKGEDKVADAMISRSIGLRAQVVRLKGQLWKGVDAPKTYSMSFSSSINRTGRVKPHKGR